MTRPADGSVVDVLGIRYVLRVKAGLRNGRKRVMGTQCQPTQRLGLDSRQGVDSMRDTLLHECVHAVSDAQHLELTESQVRYLATGLRAVFTANQRVAKFVSE